MDQIDQLLAIGKRQEAANLIRKYVAEHGDTGERNVRYAHVLALDCDWEGVTRLLPPDMNVLETSGWLRSLEAGRPVDKGGAPIPWLNYAVIDFIGEKINPQMRIFEWGAGYSSLWFASKAKEVISVEDNVEWYQEVSKNLPHNLNVLSMPAQADYVGAISNQSGLFDVIVIDGSSRNDCARACIDKLSLNGFVIFDNSDSVEFDPSMELFNKLGFFRIDFWGLIPSYLYKNCTSILFRNADLLKSALPPSRQQLCTGISCFQAHDKRVSGNR